MKSNCLYRKIFMLICVFACIFCLTGCGGDGKAPGMTRDEAQRNMDCSNRSDSYNKCNWSYHENRCVCKRR